ncbi:MAG: phosphopantetheine-binding protein [Clostridiaceae bacterium]|nr:phosphopantetheine-binding protein [Clostridiaceae bacterium]
MDKIQEFLLDYIQREYSLPEDVDFVTFNYVESGYIDSMGLVQFIATIEDEFGIEFADEDLENPKIHVIGGLIDFIKSKMDGELSGG